MKTTIITIIIVFALTTISYCQNKEQEDPTDASINAFKQAIAANPEFVEAHYNLGVLYDEKGMTEEAIGAYIKTIETDANFVKAYNNLSVIYYKLKQTDKAIETIKRPLPYRQSIQKRSITLEFIIMRKHNTMKR